MKSSIQRPFAAYSGDDPPVFVCYAHEDAEIVYDFIAPLHHAGVPIWYDEGIEVGSDWRDGIATALDQAQMVLFFQSQPAIASQHCRKELGYALDKGITVLRILLDNSTLPPALRLGLQTEQALNLDAYSKENAIGKLLEALHVRAPETDEPNIGHKPKALFRWPAIIGSALVAIALAWWGLFTFDQSRTTSSLAELRALVDHDEQLAAFRLASESGNPALKEYLVERGIGFPGSWLWVEPAGTKVFVREASADPGTWVELGSIPLGDQGLPFGNFLWRFELDGYHTREMQLSAYTLQWLRGPITLDPVETPTVDVAVAALKLENLMGNYVIEISDAIELPSFRIDAFETTNARYKEFLDSGGYEDSSYWQDMEFQQDDRRLSFDEATALMVDATGRPGPANWEFGTYPAGEGDHPVSGISWYEAMAYARFRGKALPTIYHWVAAAMPVSAQDQVEFSNYSGDGTWPVGGSIPGHTGTHDIFGNVREWLLNETGSDGRWIQGGGWDDPPYISISPFALPPMDRNPRNGVRLATYAPQQELGAPVQQTYTDLARREPVGDEAFTVIADQYRLPLAPLAPEIEFEETTDQWRRQVVSIESGEPGERLRVHLFLPLEGNGPWQSVVHFPYTGPFMREADSIAELWPFGIEFLPRTGRAIVQPVYFGSYERYDGLYDVEREERAQMQTELRRRWHIDVARVLDYLQTRDDFDSERIGYFGDSLGASHALPLLALEPRLQAAVLSAGGLGDLGFTPMPVAADPINFLPRVRQPVLMLSGTYDYIFPVTTQELMFSLLGTSEEHKQRRVFPSGHNEYPPRVFRRLVVDWFDRYLGSVDTN